MQDDLSVSLSLLHADSSFFPVYEKQGYSCTLSRWSTVNLNVRSLFQSATLSSKFCIRDAQFPNDTEQLQALHKAYSEDQFVGCIVRSKEYWNSYLSKELDGTFFVLVDSASNDRVLAWISLRFKNGKYIVRDFGADFNGEEVTSVSSFVWLLKYALSKFFTGNESVIPDDDTATLQLPTVLCDALNINCECGIDWSDSAPADDSGWMWRKIANGEEPGYIDMNELAKQMPHLIWPADSF
eukprot:CAMPEP_0171312180 /NCGR_PEP_ID=MMETSP0816-20121228/22495_1 /TAXON_ID=420281 /ORGANISM="Proboscia inermis, Strain CCAP1064/1" /LENGTH=239 /DNA_ID=CAMNT_0011797449 /DNA_START=150 /DNA_END=869 /DNA_ORIENTATION=+